MTIQVSIALYKNMTARKTKVNSRSIVSVSAEPVMKLRMFSNSRMRATESPTRRLAK